MFDTLPELEFVLAWQRYRVGDRVRPPASLRDWLIDNGYARIVRPAKLSALAAAKLTSGAMGVPMGAQIADRGSGS